MDSSLKKKLRALSLALRHTLEGFGSGPARQPGDLELRLNQMGVWRDRSPKPVEELPQLTEPDLAARRAVDAFLRYREQAVVSQEEAFAEFVRESAYSWANRLFTLRCLESRGLIDEVVLQKQVYGGRSLVHHHFARQNPAACSAEDDGLFLVLEKEFRLRAADLPALFDPQASATALRPSVSAIRRCIGLLSGTVPLNGQGEVTDDLFEAGDALGWAYQFWNAEEKDRVFEKVRTEKGAKIEGADLIPATQLYTEPYMVKFLVQNSLGALWAGMYPETKLPDSWEYYVRDADRTPPVQPDPPPFDPAEPPKPSTDPWIRPNPKLDAEGDIAAYARTMATKVPGSEASGFVDLRNQLLDAATRPVLAKLISLNQEICEAWRREWPARRPKLKKRASELTFLDPACGSGHFLLEAFDLLYTMYGEEDVIRTPEDICASILNHNLFGIDIDERAIQISVAALWMHALECAPHLRPEAVTSLGDHIIAANLSLPRGRAHLEEFLAKHPEDAELRPALEAVFRGLADANELGTLVRIEEPVEQELKRRKEEEDQRAETVLRQSQAKLDFMSEQLVLTVRETRDYAAWKRDVLERLREHFRQEVVVSDPVQAFFGNDAGQALRVFELLARRYDVVAANPPYLGRDKSGGTLNQLLGQYPGGADLYGAFIDRALELGNVGGYVAVLSLANFLHGNDFVDFRKRLLSTCRIESLVNLSNKTFEDLSNPNAFYFALTVLVNLPSGDVRTKVIDLDGTQYEQKRDVLLGCLNQPSAHRARLFMPPQESFLEIPDFPIAYKIPEWGRVAYARKRYVSDVADARQGLSTGKTERFLRYRWECPPLSKRWFRHAKGGTFRRWFGNNEWFIDWELSGARIRHFVGSDGKLRSAPRNVHYFLRDGCTWSSQTISAFAVRRLEDSSTFDTTGSSAFPRLSSGATTEHLMAVFNAPAFGELFSSIQPGVHFGEGYLEKLPFPIESWDDSLPNLVRSCVGVQKKLDAMSVISEQYVPVAGREDGLVHAALASIILQACLEAELHRIECSIWDTIEPCLGMQVEETTTARRFAEHADLPSREEIFAKLATCRPRSTVSCWRATQNSVEELALRLRIHPDRLYVPISTTQPDPAADYAVALKDPIHHRMKEFLSVAALKVLGHVWPGEGNARSHPSEDGVTPFVEVGSIEPLHRRVSTFLDSTFVSGSAREFEGATGTKLESWLQREFFSSHVSTFLTRPIAWHVQTQPSGKGATPVFSCLCYYPRIVGVLPSIRTQYAGTLRTSFESEQRTLEGLTQLTADQSARKPKLGFWVDELKQFQETLESIEAHGFATTELRRYAIVGAIHSLARQWLGHMREELRNGPLPGWQEKAAKEDLHPDFSCWIADAVAHVDRQCVAIAPDSPAPDTPDEELAPTTLAKSFSGQAPSMIGTALDALCREWQSHFDKALLQPLREQIKAAEEEYNQLEDNIENKLSRKDLKSKVKALRNEIASLSAKSGALAEQIQDWRCPEAETWVEWLSKQPLYDEFAGLDGRRSVPKTVAEFVSQESQYAPDINDGVRVNIAPLQKAGILARDVLAAKDVDKAIADRAEWRAEERRWCRQGVLPRPGWWPEAGISATESKQKT
jgi:hypothetical protein